MYNNRFSIQNFFSNRKFAGTFPQFNKGGNRQTVLSDTEIFNRSQRLLNGLLNGKIIGDSIEVRNMPHSRALAISGMAMPLIENMFNNIDKVLGGIKQNKKVYTNIATLSQAANYKSVNARLKLLNDIMDNIKYSPDFDNKPSREQRNWMLKVGYKE